ncbi:uncharacterized protein [Euphorbia lathyris]|uniref:uncharacterized protein n=1 Tax=Euphorbia lathyris TaxID=212925 RepID=UPI0033135D6C
MAHRTSGVGFGTTSSMSRDSNELVGKPSQALRSTPRWPGALVPGALVQDQHGYMIPKTQRKRFGFHNFPRTPYSRTNHSTTKFRLIQLQGNHGTHPSIMTNPFEQTTTPLKQVHSKTNALNAYQRYVGPIRRLRHKFNVETPARRSVNITGAKRGYWCNSEGLFSAPKQNVENGGIDSQCTKPQNTELFTVGVPAQSSRVARKIIEHLNRNPPTHIDKSAMLRRIAWSWKKQQQEPGNKVNAVATASDMKVATALIHGDYAGPSQDLTKTQNAQHKGASEDVLKVQWDASAASAELPLASSWKKQQQESGNKVNAVATASASASDIKVATALTHGNYAWPSQDLTKTQKAQHKGTNEDVLKVPSDASASEQKIPPRTSSAKPMLPNIAIDNSMGFSFPVIAPSSDPPTPTFKSTFSVVGQSEGSSVPSCSFPWTSSGSIRYILPVPDIVVCLL